MASDKLADQPDEHCPAPPNGAQPDVATPASYGRRTSTAAPKAVEALPARRQMSDCLLVDDSRMIRKLSRKIVEARGYRVSEAENGEEALAKCAIAMPDLIILDWDMPVMTGIEFVAELRECVGGDHPKVLFCTTHSGAKDIHEAIDLGADDFITKPFDTAGLMAKLDVLEAQ